MAEMTLLTGRGEPWTRPRLDVQKSSCYCYNLPYPTYRAEDGGDDDVFSALYKEYKYIGHVTLPGLGNAIIATAFLLRRPISPDPDGDHLSCRLVRACI